MNVKSYLNSITDIVGEFKPHNIYSIYGDAMVGKTLYLLGEAFNLASQGMRVIWIDTEGGFNEFYNRWAGVFKQRFGYKDDIMYVWLMAYSDVMRYFGFDVSVDYNKDKLSVLVHGEVKKGENTIYDVVGQKKNYVIIIDSMSSIFRLQFGSNTQNFPARADAMSLLIYALSRFMAKTDGFVITSNHESINPTNPYLAHGEMRGGNVVKYYSKFILYFEKRDKKALSNYRKIWGVRIPDKPDWSIYRWAKITNNGYEDSSDAEVEKVLQDAK